jgi:hypothetical protein
VTLFDDTTVASTFSGADGTDGVLPSPTTVPMPLLEHPPHKMIAQNTPHTTARNITLFSGIPNVSINLFILRPTAFLIDD